jgi:hypothetical protein
MRERYLSGLMQKSLKFWPVVCLVGELALLPWELVL